MTPIKIEDTWYQADEQVVKRMGEYYDAMKQLLKENESLILAIDDFRSKVKASYNKPCKANRTAAHYARQLLFKMVPEHKVQELELSLK